MYIFLEVVFSKILITLSSCLFGTHPLITKASLVFANLNGASAFSSSASRILWLYTKISSHLSANIFNSFNACFFSFSRELIFLLTMLMREETLKTTLCGGWHILEAPPFTGWFLTCSEIIPLLVVEGVSNPPLSVVGIISDTSPSIADRKSVV